MPLSGKLEVVSTKYESFAHE